jgi:hypothetical protein
MMLFVKHEDERSIGSLRPAGEDGTEGAVPSCILNGRTHAIEYKRILQVGAGAFPDIGENRSHGPIHVFTSRLTGFHIAVERPVLAGIVQVLHKGEEAACFAGLAGRVEDEVFLLSDE